MNNEQQINLDEIQEKIAKLLNKAESAKELGSLEEAAAFTAKVSELLMKYNLSLSDIKGKKDKDDVMANKINLADLHGYNKTEGDWIVQLYNCIAKFNLCRVIKINKGDSLAIMLLGDKYNVETVLFISSQMVNRLKILQRQRFKEYSESGGPEKKGTFKRAYFIGAINAIWDKLEQQKVQMERENSNVTTLVRTNELAIADKVEELFGDRVKSGKARKVKGQDGAGYGYQDGKNMEINKGLNEAEEKEKIR
jgi:hypothetical protein